MKKRPHTQSSPWSIRGFLFSPGIKEKKAVCKSSDTSQLSQLLVVQALIWVTATLWRSVDCFLDDFCALLTGVTPRAAKWWSDSNLSQTEAIFPDAQADKGKHEMLLRETKLGFFSSTAPSSNFAKILTLAYVQKEQWTLSEEKVLPGKLEPRCQYFTQTLWPRPGSYGKLKTAWNYCDHCFIFPR